MKGKPILINRPPGRKQFKRKWRNRNEHQHGRIREVMAVAKRLDEKTLVNTFEGNISAKVDGKIYITPTTKNKGLLTEDMIAVMDENGNQIHGNCKPHL